MLFLLLMLEHCCLWKWSFLGTTKGIGTVGYAAPLTAYSNDSENNNVTLTALGNETGSTSTYGANSPGNNNDYAVGNKAGETANGILLLQQPL